jgi:hypothetical protein
MLELLIALPKPGFKLESWGDKNNTKEPYIIFYGNKNENYSVSFSEL